MAYEDLGLIIFRLLKEQKEINLSHIIKSMGVVETPASRRAIQRELKKLVDQKILMTRGKARARVYYLAGVDDVLEQTPSDIEKEFKDIPLSEESRHLLKYLSTPVSIRKPVSYHVAFLKSYQPNQTYYLPSSLREELLKTGCIEKITRPAGTYARHILSKLLIDLSWNSSRLEGNTYTLLETRRLIELGENAVGKDALETQMILNHKGAIEYILESAHEDKISSFDIRSIHALLSENLLGDASASGRIRQIAVGISGTTYIPLDNPHILKECFDIFIEKLNRIKDSFEQSFFALLHLSYLQAFEDVNKRTARLVANIPFIKKNLNPLSFIDVNQKDYATALIGAYETNDISLLIDLYHWAYKRSAQQYSAVQQSVGEPNVFKLKYRAVIHDMIRTLILEKVPGSQLVPKIRGLIENLSLSESDAARLFEMIEIEILGLHDGNIARFKIRPSEFQQWKVVQLK